MVLVSSMVLDAFVKEDCVSTVKLTKMAREGIYTL